VPLLVTFQLHGHLPEASDNREVMRALHRELSRVWALTAKDRFVYIVRRQDLVFKEIANCLLTFSCVTQKHRPKRPRAGGV